jgi:hypothetical protein
LALNQVQQASATKSKRSRSSMPGANDITVRQGSLREVLQDWNSYSCLCPIRRNKNKGRIIRGRRWVWVVGVGPERVVVMIYIFHYELRFTYLCFLLNRNTCIIQY